MSRVVGQVCFGVTKGYDSVSMGVEDDGHGPSVVIRSRHGSNDSDQRIYVDLEVLDALARVFAHASQYESYSNSLDVPALLLDGTPFHLVDDIINDVINDVCDYGYDSPDCSSQVECATTPDASTEGDEIIKSPDAPGDTFLYQTSYQHSEVHVPRLENFPTFGNRLRKYSSFSLNRKQHIWDSVAGDIRVNGVVIQKFRSFDDGMFELFDICKSPHIKVDRAFIQPDGAVTMYWAGLFDLHDRVEVLCSYEYIDN